MCTSSLSGMACLERNGCAAGGYRLGALRQQVGGATTYVGFLSVELIASKDKLKLPAGSHTFVGARRPCGTAEAALAIAGLQFCWEAGVCPDSLMDFAGAPALAFDAHAPAGAAPGWGGAFKQESDGGDGRGAGGTVRVCARVWASGGLPARALPTSIHALNGSRFRETGGVTPTRATGATDSQDQGRTILERCCPASTSAQPCNRLCLGRMADATHQTYERSVTCRSFEDFSRPLARHASYRSPAAA
ncbi:MAG: hypothetical protein J3K34DRAFT_183864 [Monoraphidium minutum]|nr:MAG: hypothetical protein J3K34DRAFT_183864 [Monoraphidium minutum]